MRAHRGGLSASRRLRRPGGGARLIPFLALTAALAVAALMPAAATAAAPRDGTGAISGAVTRGDNSGIGGVEVTAYPEGSSIGLPAVHTAADGTYTVSGLSSGGYRLRFFDPSGRFVTEFYNNKPTIVAADAVGVTDGATTAHIDAKLAALGSLSGVIKSAAGKALKGIKVDAWIFDGFDGWQWAGGATTDAAGKYTVKGLVPGDYRVAFADPSGKYLAEYYNNAHSLGRADYVLVLAGRITINVDARLDLPGSILGTVTDAASAGVAGITVTVLLGDGDGHWEPVGSTVTHGSGGYLVENLPTGTCRVKFADPKGRYLTRFYQNAATVAGATDVVVTAGKSSAGVDVRLVAAARIGGKVMRPNGSGLSGIHVSALRKAGSGWRTAGSAVSDLGGEYTIGSLRAGTYRVKFADSTGVYVTEYWDDELLPDQADAVVLKAGAVRRTVSARLSLAGSISGVVKNPGGKTLAGIMATAFRKSGSDWVWAGSARTGTSGSYRVVGLAAGTYRVRIADPKGTYRTVYFRAADAIEAATDVAVLSGHTTWRISVTMKAKS